MNSENHHALLDCCAHYLEEERKESAADLEMSDMASLKVQKQESPSTSTEDLITKKAPLDQSDGGWFSKPPKDEDATEPDWVTLTWRSKLPRFLPFSLLIPEEERRRVQANNREYNRRYPYAGNVVITSKYNVLTFIPRNLFEQFLRVANLYFLLLTIIQLIPGISSVPFYSTMIPLVIVLSITAAKDAFDDIKRHVSDYRINNRSITILTDSGEPDDSKWRHIKVGNILLLEKDDFIPSDILLLSSSEPHSLCYIETAELDGETNLKVRQPLPDTHELRDYQESLAKFDGYVECEPPNNRLHKFVGTLKWKKNTYSLDNDKILLRGCRMRNTEWAYGMVIYAGHDTKLVQNSGKTVFKRTHIDELTNKLVIFILGFLAVLLVFSFIGSLVFEEVYGEDFQVYVPYATEGIVADSPVRIAFLQILSNLVILNTFVPISLYVSVEVIRLGQSFFINWDRKMYYEPNDVPAVARTTTLNEELGQIEYIFSDKTGTLTQNIMNFSKCSINGKKYGDLPEDDTDESKEVSVAHSLNNDESTEVSKTKSGGIVLEPVDLSWNSYAEPDFKYYDEALVKNCRDEEKDCYHFFRLIALCHTVISSVPEGKSPQALEYNAQSPDEAALVSAARNFGYVFLDRTPCSIILKMTNRNEEVEYTLLHILDFNNVRKRMSVIVQDKDEKIWLMCKGADSKIFERLHPDSNELMQTTLEHLADYAHEGLRTLCLAQREIPESEYTAWEEKHHEASCSLDNRDEKLDAVYEEIEQNLHLLGATAIEDKLQDGVPETIFNLAKANIKIWVLTGDKQETAINIGYSCKLLTEDMKEVLIIDAEEEEEVLEQLKDANEKIDSAMTEFNERGDQADTTDGKHQEAPAFAIVLNGHSLQHALLKDNETLLLETASKCKAVICCRVTPLQKKLVVDLVKEHKKAVTLAIGDGANDVGMIKAAHIGVGISGQEGQQAVLASDFSFGQFRYLERLLLVHGRWSYHRMTQFLRYFFYKNFAFTFSQFLFGFFCGFTAQTLYDAGYISVYNVIYTSIPVLALAILDQDVDEGRCLKYPKLYVLGQQNVLFNPPIFFRSLLKGIFHAIVIFFVLMGCYYQNFYSGDGYEVDYQSFSYIASGALTFIVTLQIALDTLYWTIITHISVWGSIILWFVVTMVTGTAPFYRSPLGYDLLSYVGVPFEVFGTGNFYFYCILVIVISLFPVMLFRIVQRELRPTTVDDVRLKLAKEGDLKLKDLFTLGGRFHPHIPARFRRPRDKDAPRRSGYAFAHERGFGKLITTGLGLRKKAVEAGNIHKRGSTLLRSRSPSGPNSTKVDEKDATKSADEGTLI